MRPSDVAAASIRSRPAVATTLMHSHMDMDMDTWMAGERMDTGLPLGCPSCFAWSDPPRPLNLHPATEDSTRRVSAWCFARGCLNERVI